MIRAARALDALAIGLGAALVLVLATGEFRIAALKVTRAEDLLVALALTAGIRSFLRPFDLPRIRPTRLVLAGVLVYAVAMSFIVLTRHRALLTHALDLGYYVQVVSAGFRIAEIGVPTRYFAEASSASFVASTAYGLRILGVLFWYTLHRRGLRRSRRFDSLRARYTRLPS